LTKDLLYKTTDKGKRRTKRNNGRHSTLKQAVHNWKKTVLLIDLSTLFVIQIISIM